MEMASLFSATARPSQLVLASLRPARTLISSINVLKIRPICFPAPSNFRFNNTKSLQLRQRSFPIPAANSSRDNSTKEEKNRNKTTDAARDPPLLTILAGFLVFFLILWVIRSVLLWLIGVIFKLTPSN